MQILKNILTILYLINCFVIIVLVMKQNRDDKGASGTIVGSSTTDNFYEKNKGRTKEGKLKRSTTIASIVFFIFTIALGIIYVI